MNKIPYTRKEFFIDAVNTYIKNNPVEYRNFLLQLAERRAKMIDKDLGKLSTKINGKMRADEEMRIAFCIPSKLFNVIQTIVNSGDNKPFGEVKGEFAWFAKTFPEFLLPKKY